MCINIVLIILTCSAAVYFDIKTYRIPNVINATGCLTGVSVNILTDGFKGLMSSILGICIPIVLLIVLLAFNIIGAGDIKLLSAIGAGLGTGIIIVIKYAFIITAVYGLGLILKRIIYGHGLRGYTRIHFSLPIAISVILYGIGGVLL